MQLIKRSSLQYWYLIFYSNTIIRHITCPSSNRLLQIRKQENMQVVLLTTISMNIHTLTITVMWNLRHSLVIHLAWGGSGLNQTPRVVVWGIPLFAHRSRWCAHGQPLPLHPQGGCGWGHGLAGSQKTTTERGKCFKVWIAVYTIGVYVCVVGGRRR